MKLFAKIEEKIVNGGQTNSTSNPSTWGASFDFDPNGKTISDLKSTINSLATDKINKHQVVNHTVTLKSGVTKDTDVLTKEKLSGPISYKVTWTKK